MIWMFKSAPKSCVYLCSLCFIPILGMRTTLVIIGFDRVKIKPKIEKSIIASVTRRKLPNVYKICPKMISLEKWKVLTPYTKLPKNVGDLGKLIVAKGFKKLPKVRKIAKSGHTDRSKKS